MRGLYDDLADQYDQAIQLPEKLLFGQGRAWIGAQARRAVLEIALGTGRNLPYYPARVRLTGLELSAAMRAMARHRAIQVGRPDSPAGVCSRQPALFPRVWLRRAFPTRRRAR